MFLPALKFTLLIADEGTICIQDWAGDCDRSSTQPPEMRKGIFSLTTRQRPLPLLSLFVRPALTVNSQLRLAIPTQLFVLVSPASQTCLRFFSIRSHDLLPIQSLFLPLETLPMLAAAALLIPSRTGVSYTIVNTETPFSSFHIYIKAI